MGKVDFRSTHNPSERVLHLPLRFLVFLAARDLYIFPKLRSDLTNFVERATESGWGILSEIDSVNDGLVLTSTTHYRLCSVGMIRLPKPDALSYHRLWRKPHLEWH